MFRLRCLLPLQMSTEAAGYLGPDFGKEDQDRR